MTLSVGWHDLEGVAAWSASGDDVSLTVGTVKPPDSLATDLERVAWAKALLQSLAGLVDEVVPITSTEWPEIDGLYRVTATPATHAVVLTTGVFDVGTIAAKRLAGGVARGVVSVVGGPRPVTAPVGAFPTGSVFAGVPGWVGAGATVDATAVDADGLTVRRVAVASPAMADVAAEIPVGQFYGGAARVEARIGGAWMTMHGRQIPPGASIRIGNGLVRLTLQAAAVPVVNVNPLWEQWSGSVWEPIQLRLTDTSGLIAYRGISGVEVVRNDPSVVTLRMWGERVLYPAAAQAMPWRAVVSVRAGVELVEVTTETEAPRWTHDTATMAVMTSGGVEYGASVASTPTLSIASDARVAVTTAAPSNVRALSAATVSRWALVRRSPADRLAAWYRWAHSALSVSP